MIPHPSTIDAVAAMRRNDLLVHAARQRSSAGANARVPVASRSLVAGATFVQAVTALRTLIGVAMASLDPPRAAARGGDRP